MSSTYSKITHTFQKFHSDINYKPIDQETYDQLNKEFLAMNDSMGYDAWESIYFSLHGILK